MAVVGEHHVQVHDLATAGEPLLFRSVVWTAVIVGQILRCATPRSQLFDLSLPPPQSLGTEPFIESHRLRWFGRVLAMSPDGGLAVSVSHRDANPVLMDLRTREPVARLDFALMWDEPLHAVAVFSPDSTTLALGNGDGVAVFDLRGTLRAGPGEDVPRLLPRYVLERPDRVAGDAPAGGQPGHWSPPFAFTPDGNQFLTLGLRERVQLYDARTGLVAAQWGWRMEDVVSLAVAPDGLTACAGGRRGRLTVWDLC
jgi:WD40 repeat protein